MTNEEMYPLTYSLVSGIKEEAFSHISEEQKRSFENSVKFVEPDIAITKALGWSIDGIWKLSDRIAESVRLWGENASRKAYRRIADLALQNAGLPGLV